MFQLCLVLLATATPPAKEILHDCQAAYDDLSSFSVDAKASMGKLPATAHIVFQRPDRLKVTGKTVKGQSFELVSSAGKTWERIGRGDWHKMDSLDLGISGISGLSLTAGSTVPSTIFHFAYGSVLGVGHPTGKVKSEKVAGHATYAIRQVERTDITVWIDKKSNLLRKTVSLVDGQRLTVTYSNLKPNVKVSKREFRR